MSDCYTGQLVYLQNRRLFTAAKRLFILVVYYISEPLGAQVVRVRPCCYTEDSYWLLTSEGGAGDGSEERSR